MNQGMNTGAYHFVGEDAVELFLVERDEPVQAHVLVLAQLRLHE